MKIYYYYDEKFKSLKNNFEKSLKDNFEKHPIQTNNFDVKSEKFCREEIGGGRDSWLMRFDVILKGIRESMGEIILLSDVDIIFFRPATEAILTCMNHSDLVFQRESFDHGLNVGFIAIKCNKETENFWQTARDICYQKKSWDQQVVNDLIYKENYKIKWSRFPQQFYNGSQSKVLSKNGQPFWDLQGKTPSDSILYHANAGKTLKEKFAQFDIVSKLVRV
jgi:hypothetical protein